DLDSALCRCGLAANMPEPMLNAMRLKTRPKRGANECLDGLHDRKRDRTPLVTARRRALSRCDAASAKRQRLWNCQASATAFRHVVIAAARSARWVWAEMRWRCTLKVL